MRWSDEDLRALERLAALELDAPERAQVRARLQRLSSLIEVLEEIEPFDPASPLGDGEPMPLRDDVPSPPLDPTIVLRNAPRREGDHFAVPRVWDDAT